MNLFAKLSARHEAGHPVRVGLIGAGKFGSMFLAQALKIPALHIAGIADLSPDTARVILLWLAGKRSLRCNESRFRLCPTDKFHNR